MTPPDHASRLTVIFVTLNRPEAARRLVASIRHHYPDMDIIVGDQSIPTSAMSSFYSYNNVLYVNLDYDCGVSEARTACANAARTEFIVLADEDFIFSEATDLSIPLLQLDADASIGFVGGSILDIHGDPGGHHQAVRRRGETYIFHDPDRGIFLTVPIDYLLPRSRIAGGRVFYECDATLNWGIMRKSLLQQVWWDARFKVHGAPENFFLDMKLNSSYKVSFCPDLVCLRHDDGMGHDTSRARHYEWALFGDKWKLRDHMEVGQGLHAFADYERSCWREKSVQESACGLPPATESYLRLWPNGQALAAEADGSPPSASVTAPEASASALSRRGTPITQSQQAKETVAWKIARPIMKTELYIRRFVRGWKAA